MNKFNGLVAMVEIQARCPHCGAVNLDRAGISAFGGGTTAHEVGMGQSGTIVCTNCTKKFWIKAQVDVFSADDSGSIANILAEGQALDANERQCAENGSAFGCV